MTENLKQKRRNRPIKITKIAIDKVPLIHNDDFTEEEDLFIRNMRQKLLLTSMELNDSKEVGVMVNIIEWMTWTILGDSNEIETRRNPDAYIALKGNRKNTLLFIHNHPSSGTFSGVDFKTFCDNESLYAMTVVGNDERLRKTAILESVGINSSRFDGDDEHEDEDELQLRLLLSEGKAVPDELLERIKIKNKNSHPTKDK